MKLKANLKNERFFLKLISDKKLKVTKNGQAFNLVTGREIGTTSRNEGYRKLSWMHPVTKKIIQVQLHRIIWAHFKGIPDNPYLLVNHKDGKKTNCALLNLELDTVYYNAQHAVNTGLRKILKGEERPNANFSDSQVLRLRIAFVALEGKVNLSKKARERGISLGTLNNMLKGITYPHVISGVEKECRDLMKRKIASNKINAADIAKIRKFKALGETSYSISAKMNIARNTVMKYW